ncbi:hypothetical protein CcCBS67573_g08897 [Chytriomyces confervae]|uniref:Uncharacterized protein n=1 Tax=Chytriomyces confervae TaxID=246404 RepID=A0A507EEE5_9FUNG|nr:hypothetical protein CcCBS67573_g08897 [Chytriomyces confervae]
MHPGTVNSPLLLGVLLLIYGSGSLLKFSSSQPVHPHSLCLTRLDRITAALIAICFVWSLGRSTIEILIATNKSTQSDCIAACFTSIVISFIFAFNFILAMERYFSIKDINGKPFYKAVYICLVLCMAVLLAMIWDAIASVRFLGASTGMVALYIATYRFTTRMFDESPPNCCVLCQAVMIVATSDSIASTPTNSSLHPRAAASCFELNPLPATTASRILDAEQLEHVWIKAEKQLLVNCIIMSAGLIICYSGSDLAEESSMDKLLDLMHLVQSSRMIKDCQSIPKTPALRNHVLQMADKEFRVHAQMNQQSFHTLVSKIEVHPIFTNNSQNKQIAVNMQLLLALEQLGCSGKGAGVACTSNHVGVSWGSAVLYT